MRAMVLHTQGPLEPGSTPLSQCDLPIPEPGPEEILLEVKTCGVCHTELDEIEGRLAPRRLPVVLGHQVVGRVTARGPRATLYAPGARVGVGWIHHSDGSPTENISPEFRATGCDVDGGYAEYMTVPQAYAVPIPDTFDDATAAPLLCAGAIGYRALKLTQLVNGASLGLMGFGGSAHLVLKLARHLFPDSAVYVFARDPQTRSYALDLGADWAGEISTAPPDPPAAIIDTTPAWLPVVASLAALRPGGRLVINAIRKEAQDQTALLQLSYHEHLWLEREIKSVANITRADIAEFLPLAAAAQLRPDVSLYALEDANRALIDLKFRPVRGAKVLRIDEP